MFIYLSVNLSMYLKVVNSFALVGCFLFFLSSYAFSWIQLVSLQDHPFLLVNSSLGWQVTCRKRSSLLPELKQKFTPGSERLLPSLVLWSWETMRTREAWNQRGWPTILHNIWMTAEWGMSSKTNLNRGGEERGCMKERQKHRCSFHLYLKIFYKIPAFLVYP